MYFIIMSTFIICLLLINVTMSDLFSPLTNLKYQECIKFTSDHSPCFVNRKDVDVSAVAITLQITSQFLCLLHKFQCETNFSYVETINTQFSFFN